MTRRRALIAGGGVGGLAAALALTRAGWDARVFERAAAIGEVGAGIQISANGYRALKALGVAEEIRAGAFAPEAVIMRAGRSGRRLVEVPLGEAGAARWGAPYLQVHRADLIETLRRALERAAPGAVRTGAEVAGYETGPDGAALRLASGETVEGALLIGADGIRSTIREAMLGPEAPRFTGAVAWRAAIPRAALEGAGIEPAAVIWAGRGRHAVTYPLRGGTLLNFVGVVGEDDWRGESWTEPGDPARLRAAFAGWAAPLTRLIDRIEAPFRWALFDRAPLPRWSDGRAVLLGDACHPMPPSLAQGACQALEDACALAARLGPGAGDIPAALRAHYAARISRVSRVQREARANLRRFHAGGLERAAAGAAGAAAPWWFARRLDWLYRGDERAM
ncbi:FAD-dependent monooxygenase [Pikeienuella sp. HZG-20]|uniref:FAD-dependent monooxygenase n=1 Tax=Paludibacillus litoralis TaxID=3133267 RepID=UPI0030ED4F63